MKFRGYLLICLFFYIIGPLHSKVIGIENLLRMPVMGNYQFGAAGSYEFISGTLIFGLDPSNQYNSVICDLDLAPVNQNGLIVAKTKFIVLQPTDPSKRNGLAFIEVSNRGGKALLRYYNNATTGQVRPNVPADYGNEYLMKQGYTLVWLGWEWDIPNQYNLLRLEVPVLKNKDSTPVTGMVRSDWVVDQSTTFLSVGHRFMNAYPVADITSSLNVLTSRKSIASPKMNIPTNQWNFSIHSNKKNKIDTLLLNKPDGFESGNIYELIYRAKDPVLVGYGLAVIRDIASYIKYDSTCLFPAKKTLAQGISQTGRFLRQFLFEGFNKDESGRFVYDGMLIFMAGAGRGSFNHRFAQPSRDAHRYSSFDYPTDVYPFGSVMVEDPVTDQALANRTLDDSLKIFYINSGYEYWGRAASLIHTDPAGLSDLFLPDNERYYHIASMQHYGESIPDSNRRVFPQYDLYKGHPMNPLPCFKALLFQMKEWLVEDRLPEPNQIPTIRAGSLIPFADYKMPYIPGVDKPVSPYIPSRLYFGPQWSDKKIIDQEPPIKGDFFNPLVPRIDSFGNESSGIRNIELRVPLATYTPWSLRYGLASSGEMDDFRGLFIPLPKEKINRTTRDMRPDFNTLYKDKEDYMHKVAIELSKLVDERFLLLEDIPLVKKHCLSLWEWTQHFYQSK
ncbi:MAG: alpha/beta hydrolase domain-containing protein [Saprospiraceae bacterium]